MEKIWGMLTDRDIYSALEEPGKLDEDFLRIMIVELLSRIKKLEQVNFALQALLVDSQLVDDEALRQTVKNAKEFMDAKDLEKAKMVDTMKKAGITFREWVNFNLRGSF